MKRSELRDLLSKQIEESGDGGVEINTRDHFGEPTTEYPSLNDIRVDMHGDTVIDLG
jgi:hypothetical protein